MRQSLVVIPLQALHRAAFALQDKVLRLLEVSIRWTALNMSPLILLLLLLALGLLFWNYRAPQAPAWIATSISVVCGGIISLLAMEKPIRRERYIVGISLVFMFFPAVLGCWATLQPDERPDQMLSFVTILEGPGAKRKPEIDPNWENEYPYMNMMRSVLEEELSQLPRDSSKEAADDGRFSRRIEMASSMDLVEVLVFQQMRWRFERDWDVRIDTSKVFGMQQVSIGPNSKIPTRKKNVWTRSALQEVLPQNQFLDQLPDSYQVVLPEGMTIRTEPIEGWPNHAVILEDAYCQIRFKPEGKSLTRAFWLSDDQEHQPFVSHLRVAVQVTFKGLRVGTWGTTRRRAWVEALFGQMKEPTRMILAD